MENILVGRVLSDLVVLLFIFSVVSVTIAVALGVVLSPRDPVLEELVRLEH